MRERVWMYVAALLITAALGAAGCSEGDRASNPLAARTGGGAPDISSLSARISIEFDPQNFVSEVDNPYLPWKPGATYTYLSTSKDGPETIVVEVLRQKKDILGVDATVVHDRVTVNGELLEDTFDWYAQDKDGNVWYLGEDTKEYENGVVVSTFGSWEAGVGGAQAGIIMLANPEKGDTYSQEDAPEIAEDMARVVSLSESVTVPYGTFSPVVKILEWTPLEPGSRGYKYYAQGIGVVLESSKKSGGERVELVSVTGL